MIYLALFILGLAGSWLATKGYLAAQSRNAWLAFWYELAAVEAGIISLQVWHTVSYHFSVLQSEAIGLAVGTFLAVRYG